MLRLPITISKLDFKLPTFGHFIEIFSRNLTFYLLNPWFASRLRPVATSLRCRGQVTRNDDANHCYSEALFPEEWLRASETPYKSLVKGQVSSPAGQNLPCTSSASRPVEDNCVSQRRGRELEPDVDDGNTTVADTSDTSVKYSCKAPTNQAMTASPKVVSPVPKAKR